jgi:hypothetical protein
VTAPDPRAGLAGPPSVRAPLGDQATGRSLIERAARLTDAQLVALIGVALFVLSAWPLLLVPLPPLQDLPNHVATAHIVAHPDLYPQYLFNGLLKSNSLLTLWFLALGSNHLFGAARLFTALVLAGNAFALPFFALHFAGRRRLAVAMLFAWPLVHGFFVSMGMLNFVVGFALSLLLLVVIDRQREQATPARSAAIGLLSVAIWYAHPFPLAVVGVLVGIHVLAQPGWGARVSAGVRLLLPLAPAGLLCLLAAQRHLVKADHAPPLGAAAWSYTTPWGILAHLWYDASGALTRWGGVTVVPALLLPYFAWRQRRIERAFFSRLAMVLLTAAYVGMPVCLSNWNYFNCRLVPFIWAGLLVRLPARVPRAITGALVACALAFSAVLGIDYVRLDRDRAAFTAGLDAVPPRATLLPLMFKQQRTSDFTASLTHAWGYYTVARDASAPLVFGVERSYPITYRDFPPRKLVPPALDRFAERYGTPAQVCASLGQVPPDGPCTAAWRDLWSGFWRDAEPRFSHLITWAMPDAARPIIPADYRRVFVAGQLEVYARQGASSASDAAPPPAAVR